MIDSQKRRAFREAQNVSLHAIAEDHNGWLPPRIERCRRPLPDAAIEREQMQRVIQRAIAALPDLERQVMRAHLEGKKLGVTAKELGKSLTWTRAKFQEAKELVRLSVQGRV